MSELKFLSGVIPQKNDARDYKILLASAILPKKYSLGELFGVYNQYNIGSCGANAYCTMLSMLNISANKEVRQNFSRLYHYYKTRETMGGDYVSQDSGVTIRDLFKSGAKNGTCLESEMEYVPNNYTVAPTPTQNAKAYQNRILEYAMVQKRVFDVKSLLHQGKPVVFGMLVTNRFLNQTTAKFELPKIGENYVGGHAMLFIGFDDTFINLDGSVGAFEIRNSWGKKWGNKGSFMLPYTYLQNENIFDFWVATKCL